MDHTPDCDEQSEFLFVFTEDAADNQSLPATSPPPTATPLPHPTESADQAFWSGVYTLDPPHALMGVLTDLHIHRFLLHQHLTTHTALSETPIGHQPLTDTLPQPIQRIIAIYHSNLQRAQHHTLLALNAIDSLARFPPAAYFTNPNLSTSDPQHPPHEAFSAPSGLQPGQPIHIPPIRRYPLPTASNTGNVVQHVSTQTSSPWISGLDTHLTPPTFHQSQQTTPPPATHSPHIQTDINAIVYYPAFAGIPATPHTEQPAPSDTTANIPSTTSPTPTAAANKQPHERWQYVNVALPTHQEQPLDFPSPIGGTPRGKRTGSPRPTPTSMPKPAPQQFIPPVQPLPKRPPPTLFSPQQDTLPTTPLQTVPPATGWPTFRGNADSASTLTATPVHASQPPPHPWPAHYQTPPQQLPPTTTTLHNTTPPANSAASSTTPAARPPLYYDSQGRQLPLHQQEYVVGRSMARRQSLIAPQLCAGHKRL